MIVVIRINFWGQIRHQGVENPPGSYFQLQRMKSKGFPGLERFPRGWGSIFFSKDGLGSTAGRPDNNKKSKYRVDAGNRTVRHDTRISKVRFGPLELRIRPMGFPAMPGRFPVLKVDSDTQNDQFLMILVRP